MWRPNLPGVLKGRTAYCVDLLGEAGLSVQEQPTTGPDDQAQWLDETIAGLGLDAAHLMGFRSAGGRPPTVRTSQDSPLRGAVSPGVREALRRRVLRWIAGGADADDSVPEAALISAGSNDFVLRSPMPKVFTDDQLRSLDIPGTKPVAERADRVLRRSIARHQRRVSRRDRRAVSSLLG
jgi:hypothetical protein